MSRSNAHLPPMQRVVEVEFPVANFNPPSFFRRYEREIIVGDPDLLDDILFDEVVTAPMQGHLRFIYPTEPISLVQVVRSSARLWQLACLLDREMRHITDPQLNPLAIPQSGISYFPMHFRHRSPPLSLKPEWVSVPWVIEIRKEVKHIRLFRRRLASVTAQPGTLILEGMD
jgi:hypothetical protein